MDVRLPDGTVIKNVPDNMTKADLTAKLHANGYDVSKLTDQHAADQGSGTPAIDAANAVGTGFWRGAARLAGLPVDTAANVVDLGKAGLGTAYHEVTGKPIPSALEVSQDRSGVVGSSDWLLQQARKSEPSRNMVDPVNPAYEGGYLQAGGGSLAGGVMNPRNLPQLANQVGLSVASTSLGKAAYDATGNPALAIAASMTPSAMQTATGAGVRRAVRGGEDGRKDMQQRVQDLNNAGVANPTLGLATGNKLIGGLENLLQNTPGAVKTMQGAREDAMQGVRAKLNEAADAASINRGSLEAGQAIQSGVRAFRDSFKAKQGALYDQLDQFIEPSMPVDVSHTKGVLNTLNADIPGAPKLSKQFKNARINSIEQAIQSDTAGSPQSVMVYQPKAVGSGGIWNTPAAPEPVLVKVPEGPSRNTLPFEAVKKTRTLVGNELADTNIASTVPRSKWTPLYGALANDLSTAADAAGPSAAKAFKRANDFTSAGMARLDRVQPFVSPDAPEQSFQLLNRTLGDNTSTLQSVKKTLPEGARGTVAATVIDRLGRATPGQQNAAGDAWSPETFLTNWNRMNPKARQELFSGFKNADQVRGDVESVAKATSMMRESSKMWANPSGTGANLAARVALGAAPLSFFVNPLAPVGIGAGMASAKGLSKLVTSPAGVEFFSNKGGQPANTQAGLLATYANEAGLLGGEERKRGLISR
jgi:hypothetical protein